jgi:hypothetical protein
MRLLPEMCHSPVVPPASIVHPFAVVGSVSVNETPVAFPVPMLEIVTTNPAVSPGLIEAASAVLVTRTSGQFTVIDVLPEDPFPPLELLYVAVLLTVPQVADVVGEVIWTVVELPDAIDVDGHVRIPPPMVQALTQPVWPAIVQVRPPLVGRVSLSVTPVAVAGPAFETVIV